MEVKILDSILHGQLKPWKIDTSSTRQLAELIKAAKAATPKTVAELLFILNKLLQHQPALQKIASSETTSASIPLRELCYKTSLPNYKDTVTQFYYLLITYETLRLYNILLAKSEDWKEPVDIVYQIGKTLNNIKVLTIQAADELKERDFFTIPEEQSDGVHFTLYYLKHSLIALYFSVQETFQESLSSILSLEDFYLLELQEPPHTIIPLIKNEAAEIFGTPHQQNEKKQPQLTFGFNGDKQSLKAVVNNLCIQIDLLKEEVSPADMLIQILLSKNIKPGEFAIHLNCDNKNFRYVLQKFSPFFNSLSFVTIEHSKSFYSRQGTPLKANNFSKAKKNKFRSQHLQSKL